MADKFVVIGPGLFELSNAGSAPYAVGGAKGQATVLQRAAQRAGWGSPVASKSATERNSISTLRMVASSNWSNPAQPNATNLAKNLGAIGTDLSGRNMSGNGEDRHARAMAYACALVSASDANV